MYYIDMSDLLFSISDNAVKLLYAACIVGTPSPIHD